tara:strand:+ start:120 stop:854 length:735 start_codon:yes stop_codon:yes gene_type:complete
MSEYRVVCMQRTGSTFLTNYIKKFYNVKSEFEFLLDSHVLHNDGTLTYDKSLRYTGASLDRVLKKLDYLDETKLSEFNFQLKIIPNSTMKLGIENRLTNYLKGYKILTIARNPWDSFMSMQYQRETNWEVTHNKRAFNSVKYNKDVRYTIKEKDIIWYATKWWYDIKFISSLEPYHVFDYEDLSAESLNKFFGKHIHPSHWPLGIDYKELVLNYDEAYTIFNNHFAGWESALYIMGSNRNEIMG